MSILEEPEHSHLRLFRADDESLWESRPQLSATDFTLDDASGEELDAFFEVLAEV